MPISDGHSNVQPFDHIDCQGLSIRRIILLWVGIGGLMTASRDDEAGREPGGTRSDLSGSAGDVVQARDIAGGIHFHPPGRSAGGETVPVPAQLPADVRGFVNRLGDIEQLDGLLENGSERIGSARVCVLTGTAGVGKTSLAVHWGHRVRGRFPDGQLYVNLRGYDPGEPITAGQALERFLTASGVAPAALPPDLETRSALFRSLLAQRRVLIVLDNAATVTQVRPLLPGAGRCLVLVTSRSRLSGLVARDGAHRLTLDLFDESAAVALLYETVDGYRSGDTEQDIAELAQLCARLPLALRIAAERAAVRPHMPMGDLIGNLRDESHLWSALSAEDDDEADAVRTVFAWSYRALPAEVARMFRLLGLHPSPEFSVHAAAAIAAVPVAEASRLLDVLVGAHLLDQIGHDRYQCHDLLRAYAVDQVGHEDTTEGRDAAIERVLAWYVHTIANCLTNLPIRLVEPIQDIHPDAPPDSVQPLVFTDSGVASAWFDAERANFVACVRLAVKSGKNRTAWQIPILLHRLFPVINAFDDWLLTTELGLEGARRLKDSAAEALLLESLSMAYRQSHHLDEAEATGRAALELFRQIGHHRGEALTSNLLALVSISARRPNLAYAYLDQAEMLAEQYDHSDIVVIVLANRLWGYINFDQFQEAYDSSKELIGSGRFSDHPTHEIVALISVMRAAHKLGRYDEAARWAETVLTKSPSKLGEATILLYHGDIQKDSGDLESALVTYHRVVVTSRQFGDRNREADALDATGVTYGLLGRWDEAASFHLEAIALYRSIHSRWGTAVALDHLAHVSVELGKPDDAARYWSEALSLLDEFDDAAAASLLDSIESSLRGSPSPNHGSDGPVDA
ncbi:ATP-binding protein [Nocardia sp. SC052]|uniref:ATP-binding protein n=1 Tax=Nocardia sichangensis TaxID=3385975 RepID=UPI00399F0D0D